MEINVDDPLTPKQAKELGFTVDDTCYPWIAYKGYRFNPTEIVCILTAKEAEQLEEIERLSKALEWFRGRLKQLLEDYQS